MENNLMKNAHNAREYPNHNSANICVMYLGRLSGYPSAALLGNVPSSPDHHSVAHKHETGWESADLAMDKEK